MHGVNRPNRYAKAGVAVVMANRPVETIVQTRDPEVPVGKKIAVVDARSTVWEMQPATEGMKVALPLLKEQLSN